jgi:hypothetical protein
MDWVGILFEEQLGVLLVERDLRVLVAGETPSRVYEVSSYCTFIKFPSLLIHRKPIRAFPIPSHPLLSLS